jgi:hypothetical protein
MPGCVGEDDEQYLVKRAEEAVAANPEKSDRAIAQEIGVSDKTVAKARKRTADQSAVAKRTGKDGKKRMSPAAPKTWAATQPLHPFLLDFQNRTIVRMEMTADKHVRHGMVDLEVDELNALRDKITARMDELDRLWTRVLAEVRHGQEHNSSNLRVFVSITRIEISVRQGSRTSLHHLVRNLDFGRANDIRFVGRDDEAEVRGEAVMDAYAAGARVLHN